MKYVFFAAMAFLSIVLSVFIPISAPIIFLALIFAVGLLIAKNSGDADETELRRLCSSGSVSCSRTRRRWQVLLQSRIRNNLSVSVDGVEQRIRGGSSMIISPPTHVANHVLDTIMEQYGYEYAEPNAYPSLGRVADEVLFANGTSRVSLGTYRLYSRWRHSDDAVRMRTFTLKSLYIALGKLGYDDNVVIDVYCHTKTTHQQVRTPAPWEYENNDYPGSRFTYHDWVLFLNDDVADDERTKHHD